MEKVNRNSYGEIIANQYSNNEAIIGLVRKARELSAKAASKKKIPSEHDGMTWERAGRNSYKDGHAVWHEVYDVSPNGKKALICVRDVEGTKYGQKTISKNYYIVAAHGNGGVRVAEAPKAIAAKAAKASGELGQAIDVCEGKAKMHNPAKEVRTGYKLVKRNEQGELVSVWDESPWEIGVTRSQGATPDHSGGFYYYASENEALAAARENEVFGQARSHDGLVMIEVRVTGREYRHPGNKRCATHMNPVRIVREHVS